MITSPTHKHRNLLKGQNSSSEAQIASTLSHRDIPVSPKNQSKTYQRDASPSNLSSSMILPNSASIKFSKAERFPPIKPLEGSPKYYLTPSSFSLKKGPSMGYGERVDIISQSTIDKASVNYPSPIDYPRKSDFDQSPERKGKSFGLGYAVYEKAYIPGNKNLSLSVSKEIPGPGAYKVEKDVIAGMGKVHFLPRGKMFNEGLGLGSPNSNHYSPKTEIIMSGRFRSIGFGFGKKYDFTKKKDYVPGPADYSPSFFKERNFSRRDVSPKVGRS